MAARFRASKSFRAWHNSPFSATCSLNCFVLHTFASRAFIAQRLCFCAQSGDSLGDINVLAASDEKNFEQLAR